MNVQKTAIVYDWLINVGGGEKTLSAIYEEFPAPIYTLFHRSAHFKGTPLEGADVHTSFLQKCPFSASIYRYLLAFYPLAIEQFDLSGYDVILSTSHAVAKSVLTHPHQLHLCYCFTPMRYAWDLTHQYLEPLGKLQRMIARPTLHYLRNWDAATAGRVDHFASISHYIAKRIKKVYGRESTVIYPPVDVEEIALGTQKEDFYLVVSRMVPYKNIDLIVKAFSFLPEKRLVVIGDGPERSKIVAAAGKNVEILGHLPDATVRDYMKRAKGFIFAAEEDFGIVVVEAQAAGTPVIALRRGGAVETVVQGQSGAFFEEPTIPSLIQAVESFERMEFDPHLVRANAMRFNKHRFQEEYRAFVQQKVEEFYEDHHSCRR
ncbi:MAG: glycosyltransferase [Chlamydiota bacterium]